MGNSQAQNSAHVSGERSACILRYRDNRLRTSFRHRVDTTEKYTLNGSLRCNSIEDFDAVCDPVTSVHKPARSGDVKSRRFFRRPDDDSDAKGSVRIVDREDSFRLAVRKRAHVNNATTPSLLQE
ncbi:uncharacterized protein LOC144924982 [Branchiostoma floridae x Branchiostoma belcheri]